jgi:hypothetical protein
MRHGVAWFSTSMDLQAKAAAYFTRVSEAMLCPATSFHAIVSRIV